MATGDVKVFDEALAKMLTGGWVGGDSFWCAILDNTATPVESFATPTMADFTEVGTAGTYVAGGLTLGVYSGLVSEATGTVTFDSGTNPSWAQHASSDTDAFWGLIYNKTDTASDALAFVDLGGPVNMSTGSLTITWSGSGLFTIA